MNIPEVSASKQGGLSRRAFLEKTAATAAVMILPSRVIGGAGTQGANSRLNIAAVGIGGQGAADLGSLASENIVALCDVDADYAAHTFAEYPGAKRYTDFRVMLEKEKGIDAVL